MKKIIIIILLFFTTVCQADTLTPEEFLQVLKKVNDGLSGIRPKLENVRIRSIRGSKGRLNNNERELNCEKIKILCKSAIQYSSHQKEYSVRMVEPDTVEKFIIPDPLTIDIENLAERIVKEVKPNPTSVNTIVGLVDKALAHHRLVSAIMEQLHIRMQGAIIFKEISFSLKPDKKAGEIEKFQSFLNSAERYLMKYRDHLQRVRELLIQAFNGIYTAEDRMILKKEITANIRNCLFYIRHAEYNNTPIFYDRNNSFKDYLIVLHESESPTIFRISSPQVVNSRNVLLDIRDANPLSPKTANELIGTTDLALESASFIRAQISAFHNRLEFAFNFRNIPATNTRMIKDHIKEIEIRIYELAIQSANGIYTDEDRKMIDAEYQELIEELNRVQKQTGIRHAYSNVKKPTVLHQKSSEKEMLRLAGILK